MKQQIHHNSVSEQLKNFWEKSWHRPDYSPSWEITIIPPEIQEAVDSEWFPCRSSILDIGCGSGKISAWLAKKDFRVLGIDFAASAITRARLEYGEVEGNLRFETLDICHYRADRPEFHALIDRGCFDGLPKALYTDYADGVASWAMTGAKFLLLCSTNKGVKTEGTKEIELQQQMINAIEVAFDPNFEITKVVKTSIEKVPTPVPALAVSMIRK